MATHSSILAWRIPGMLEPGGLPSMGLHRVRHDRSDLAAAAETLVVIFSDRITSNENNDSGNADLKYLANQKHIYYHM